MKKYVFAALAATMLSGTAAWADSAGIGDTGTFVTRNEWYIDHPATYWTYVPPRKSLSEVPAVQVPFASPQYHLVAVAPTIYGACHGCAGGYDYGPYRKVD